MPSYSPEFRKQSTQTSAARGVVFRLIINITYSCLVYYTFTASVLLGHSYLPPLDLLESACHLPSLLWSCQRVPVSLLAPCHLSPAELCLPPTYAYSGSARECLSVYWPLAISVLLSCAYHQPMPTLVLPESAYNLLRLLWSSQRVPTSACWSYLLGAACIPSHQRLPGYSPI
jgi:hypothetical protein